MAEQAKVCSKCWLIKALQEFHKRADAKDGRRGACKACDHQRLLDASRKYAAANAEKKRESFRQWYERNKVSQRERARQYAEKNATALTNKRYEKYWDSPEKFRQRAREWARANPNKRNAMRRRWEKDSPLAAAYIKRKDASSARAYKKGMESLSDSYVKQALVATGLPSRKDATPELIGMKREQLKIHRAMKQLNQAIKDVTQTGETK